MARKTILKTKKTCCQSSPRCKRCPVVWDRLTELGLAKRASKRRWRMLVKKIPKKTLRSAREY